jgi:Domain of unknown function (DUF4402)
MNWGFPHGGILPRSTKRAVSAALVGACASLLPTALHAESVTRVGTTDAVVVERNTLIKVDDMNFARVGSRTTAGAVVLSPVTNLCTSPNGVVMSGTCQPAQFAGMGRRNFFIRVQYPTAITLTGPGQAMTVDTITLNASPDLTLSPPGSSNGNRRYLIVSLSGIFSFKMGGTLRVNANQAAGVYNGTYTVTAVYN